MKSPRFICCVLAAAIGCQGSKSTTPAPAGDLGSLAMSLRAEVNGVPYRLRDAVFQITGQQTASLRTEDDPDAGILSQDLQPGMYTIELLAPYRLEKRLPTGYQDVVTELISPNPRPFIIRAGRITRTVFTFRTEGAIVGVGSGQLYVSIEVTDTSNLPGVNALAVGSEHTCVRVGRGTVTCWGQGSYGALGLGIQDTIGDDNETPYANVSLGAFVDGIAAGGRHTCALSDGQVRCWGDAQSGQLGYGNLVNIGDDEAPRGAGIVDVGGQAVQLGLGGSHTCALLDDGRVRCWGAGAALGHGNLVTVGDDETPASAGDVAVGGVVAQLSTKSQHTCALLVDGRVRCWGDAQFGRLGYGNLRSIGDDETPASAGDVPVGGTVVQLAAGVGHTCALLDDGRVRCWGQAGAGILGYGNPRDIGDDETPASAGDVDVGGPVLQLAAGGVHTCALLEGGRVRCWGFGLWGALGYGNANNIGDDESPASAGDVPVGGFVVQIGAGDQHTCALLDTGHVRCWGLGTSGRLGYGNTNNIGDDETPASAGDVPVP